jgi:hypothetical protein
MDGTGAAAAGVVSAVMAGDWGKVITIILIFAAINYGAYIFKQLSIYVLQAITWARGQVNELPFFDKSEWDDRFFDLLEKGCSNTAHTEAMLAEMVADGVITKEEWAQLGESAWVDFKANLGVQDIWGFGKLLIADYDPNKTPTAVVEGAIRPRFDANFRRTLGEVSLRVSGLRVERSVMMGSPNHLARGIQCLPEVKTRGMPHGQAPTK